jgi:glyoxylase-like metal-dependent hydrolase (beta-lactamase superfamily II)
MNVKSFFDHDSHTASYVVYDKEGGRSAVIDSVMDWNNKNYTTDTQSAEEVIAFIKEHNLTNEWILETHMHADHLSASQFIKKAVGGKIAIGDKISVVQTTLKGLFNLNDSFITDGSNFDHTFADGDEFTIGDLKAKAVHVPGHTPADMMYVIEGSIFSGDTIFMPDVGTARCDFPGGDAEALWDSIQKILAYPDETKIYLCHDYPEGKGRDVAFMTTVAEEKRENIHVKTGTKREEFLKFRAERDATLDLPTYIFPSMHINARAGELPGMEDNNATYLKIPINWWKKSNA